MTETATEALKTPSKKTKSAKAIQEAAPPEPAKRTRGRPRGEPTEAVVSANSKQQAETKQHQELLRDWEARGRAELIELRLNLANDSEDKLDNRLSVAGAAMLYMTTLVGRTKATRDSYHYGCRRFMWFLYQTETGPAPEVKIVDLPSRVLLNYNQWLMQTYGTDAPATISLYLTVARNLLEFLSERELTPQNTQFSKLVAGLKKQRIRASYKTPRVQPAAMEEVARAAFEGTAQGQNALKDKAPSEAAPAMTPRVRGKGVRSPGEARRLELLERRNRALILTLYTTGMRRGEVVRLNREDIEDLLGLVVRNKTDLSEAKLQIIITGKGRKERMVFLDAETLLAIAEYLQLRGEDGYRPLFLQHNSNRNARAPGTRGENYRIRPQAIWLVVREFAGRLGLKLTPHKFRHNLATTLLNNGAQLSEVQELLGHANPATTKMIYAHYSTAHLREAFDKYRRRVSE